MPVDGKLEDISIADVLQLLHLAQKTGTLTVESGGERSILTFEAGAITSAFHPSPDVDVGKILLQQGAVTEEDIAEAVAEQKKSGERRLPFMATLTTLGLLEQEAAGTALKTLIEKTVQQIITWQRGTFNFNNDELGFSDELSHFPSDIAPDINLDMQGLLMEALRLFDEKNLKQTPGESKPASIDDDDDFDFDLVAPDPVEPEAETAADNHHEAETVATAEKSKTEDNPLPEFPVNLDADEKAAAKVLPLNRKTAAGRPVEKPSTAEIFGEMSGEETENLLDSISSGDSESGLNRSRQVILFCNDGFIKHSIKSLCLDDGIQVYTSAVEGDILKKIGAQLGANNIPVIVADFSEDEVRGLARHKTFGLVQRIKKHHPEAPLIALSSSQTPEMLTRLYKVGARTVLPKPAPNENRQELVADMKALFEILRGCLVGVFNENDILTERSLLLQNQMAVLKRRALDLSSDHASQEISLVILQYMAENLDRAIIFLVRENDLLGLGAFGVENGGASSPIDIMKIKIPIDRDSVFRNTIENRTVFHGESNDPILAESLYNHIGRPINNEILLLPLTTQERTIIVLYGDFGKSQPSPIELDALEILSNQAGLAFENALLKKKLEGAREAAKKVTVLPKR